MVPLLRSHNSFINFRFKHLNFRGAMRAAGSASTQNIDTNGTEHPPPAQQQQQQQQRVHWDQVPQNSFTELGINKSLYATAGENRIKFRRLNDVMPPFHSFYSLISQNPNWNHRWRQIPSTRKPA